MQQPQNNQRDNGDHHISRQVKVAAESGQHPGVLGQVQSDAFGKLAVHGRVSRPVKIFLAETVNRHTQNRRTQNQQKPLQLALVFNGKKEDKETGSNTRRR